MKPLFLVLISILIASGCERDLSSQFPYIPPVEYDDGIRVGTLADAHMDEELIRKAVARIHQGKYGEVHSMLIYKNDHLVYEEYFGGS